MPKKIQPRPAKRLVSANAEIKRNKRPSQRILDISQARVIKSTNTQVYLALSASPR
jgi:hypothetical protein